MSYDGREPHNGTSQLAAEEDFRGLLQKAGPREQLPAADQVAIKSAARAAWKEMVAEAAHEAPRRSFRYGVWALAASIVLVVLTGVWFVNNQSPTSVANIATVEFFAAPMTVDGRALAVGDSVAAGTTLATQGGNGHAPSLSLRLADGQSLRLDSATRVKLESGSRFALEQGAVYVDSGPLVPAGATVEVVTPYGVVRDIGTQFEVRLEDETEEMTIRVREGRISLRMNGDALDADAGEQLIVGADGTVERNTVSLSGPEWSWVVAAAPSIDIEGRSLDEFLSWVSRETGLRVRYENPGLQATAGAIQLHGSIDGLRPDEAVGVILEGSGLEYTAENGSLVVTQP